MVLRWNYGILSSQLLCICVLVSLLLTSCNQTKEPEFIGIENAKLQDISGGNVLITAELKYFNPNLAGGNVKNVDIDIIANDVSLGKASQSEEISVKANKEFKIPLLLTVPTSDLIQNEGDILSGIFDALVKKEVKLNFKGTTTVQVLGIDFDHQVNYEEKVKL